MNKEIDLTPQYEELKRALNGKIDDETIMKELKKYVYDYNIIPDVAKSSILKRFDSSAKTSFVTADAITKKIGDLTGKEMNVDITAKAVYVDKKEITVRNVSKTIVSGILGDESGTAPFTIWEGSDVELVKGEVYIFKNAYTKTWNDRVQINLGSRGKVEKTEGIRVDVPDRTLSAESREMKIGDIKDGVGNITVTGRILSTEIRNIVVKNEPKVVYSGMIADDTGKIQYSAWNDYSLKEGETICVKNAYIRAWRGIPQLNLGDRCEVSRVDDTFGDIEDKVAEKSIQDIVNVGGALDVCITGTVVDLRTGSGLIKRCPECNRSVLNDECTTHGHIEPVFDLRMKLIIDDGTGAMSAIVNRADTEKLTGITLDAAMGLAKARGEIDAVAKDMAQMIIMKRVSVSGNVMSDDYGPMMIVKSATVKETDTVAEAEELYGKVEAAL